MKPPSELSTKQGSRIRINRNRLEKTPSPKVDAEKHVMTSKKRIQQPSETGATKRLEHRNQQSIRDFENEITLEQQRRQSKMLQEQSCQSNIDIEAVGNQVKKLKF